MQQIPRVRDQVVDSLRDAIVNGQFVPGQLLSEGELCETLGTSRASLRQALRILEAEGLIDVRKGRGVFVTKLDAPTAKEIYLVRATLEGLLARLFVEAATEEDIARVQEVIRDMETAPGRSSANAEVIRAAEALYDLMFDRVGNRTLEGYLRVLHRRIPLLRAATIQDPQRREASVQEMRIFADAVVDRDVERAGRAMEEHVHRASAVAQQILSRETAE